MDGQQTSHRTVEREKIRDMVCDAVRILCQNTVSHHSNLSIQALFGITIDDGEDAIIFSINESVDAADNGAHQTEEHYETTETDASYPSNNLQEMKVNNSHFNDSVTFDQQYEPSVPYQAVVKKETSVISYNVGQYGTFPQSSITSNESANQYFATDGSYSGYEDVGYGDQSAFGQNTVASEPRRVRGRGPTLKRAPRRNMTNARNLPTVKQEHESDVSPTVTGIKSSVNTPEVSHVTLYTCQTCGKQMNRLSSFHRHKKSHLGIIYRCDGCGKALSRGDHLKAHQRSCPAALQQAALR